MPWADNRNLSRVQPCGHGCTTVSCSLIGRFRSWRYVLIINFFLEPDNACRTVFACQQCNQMEVVHRPCSACICLWETTWQNQMLKWNLNLSTFQRHLKTFLFKKSFPDIIADWHFSGPCGNLNYLGHSKKFCMIDWLIELEGQKSLGPCKNRCRPTIAKDRYGIQLGLGLRS